VLVSVRVSFWLPPKVRAEPVVSSWLVTHATRSVPGGSSRDTTAHSRSHHRHATGACNQGA
jgi:hypothetical protein